MPIRRGEPWGSPATRPPDLTRARSDAELADWVTRQRPGAYGLAGGDLYRSLGSPPDRADMQRLALDALEVDIDGRSMLAVAHVVARRGWWRGGLLAVMNADHIGDWNVAPRAHPNDGRFDIVEVSAAMPLRSRVEARRRLVHGTHLPHPDISVRTAEHASWEFVQPTRVFVDGVDHGRAQRLCVRLLPDHVELYV